MMKTSIQYVTELHHTDTGYAFLRPQTADFVEGHFSIRSTWQECSGQRKMAGPQLAPFCVVRYTLAKWIVSKNVPLQNLRPVASGIHIQFPCGVIRLHPVYTVLYMKKILR